MLQLLANILTSGCLPNYFRSLSYSSPLIASAFWLPCHRVEIEHDKPWNSNIFTGLSGTRQKRVESAAQPRICLKACCKYGPEKASTNTPTIATPHTVADVPRSTRDTNWTGHHLLQMITRENAVPGHTKSTSSACAASPWQLNPTFSFPKASHLPPVHIAAEKGCRTWLQRRPPNIW